MSQIAVDQSATAGPTLQGPAAVGSLVGKAAVAMDKVGVHNGEKGLEPVSFNEGRRRGRGARRRADGDESCTLTNWTVTYEPWRKSDVTRSVNRASEMSDESAVVPPKTVTTATTKTVADVARLSEKVATNRTVPLVTPETATTVTAIVEATITIPVATAVVTATVASMTTASTTAKTATSSTTGVMTKTPVATTAAIVTATTSIATAAEAIQTSTSVTIASMPTTSTTASATTATLKPTKTTKDTAIRVRTVAGITSLDIDTLLSNFANETSHIPTNLEETIEQNTSKNASKSPEKLSSPLPLTQDVTIRRTKLTDPLKSNGCVLELSIRQHDNEEKVDEGVRPAPGDTHHPTSGEGSAESDCFATPYPSSIVGKGGGPCFTGYNPKLFVEKCGHVWGALSALRRAHSERLKRALCLLGLVGYVAYFLAAMLHSFGDEGSIRLLWITLAVIAGLAYTMLKKFVEARRKGRRREERKGEKEEGVEGVEGVERVEGLEQVEGVRELRDVEEGNEEQEGKRLGRGFCSFIQRHGTQINWYTHCLKARYSLVRF